MGQFMGRRAIWPNDQGGMVECDVAGLLSGRVDRKNARSYAPVRLYNGGVAKW